PIDEVELRTREQRGALLVNPDGESVPLPNGVIDTFSGVKIELVLQSLASARPNFDPESRGVYGRLLRQQLLRLNDGAVGKRHREGSISTRRHAGLLHHNIHRLR